MTDTVQTEAFPENGPWNKTWKDIATAGGNLIQDVASTVSQGAQELAKKALGPWNMSWEDLSSKTAKNRPVEPPKPTYEFDTVFSNLIGAESQGKHSVNGKLLTSKAGAEGITQVMPKTSGNPGYGVMPIQDKSEAEYKRFGRDYLKAMLKEFDGDYEKALAAYNAGVGNVKKAIAKGEDNWKDFLPKRSETLPYIEKILNKKVVQKEVNDRFIGDADPQYSSLNNANKRGLAILDKEARKNPEFQQVESFLKSVGGMPKIQAGYGDENGAFTRGGDTPKEGVISLSNLSFINGDNPVKASAVATYLHEHTHAAMYQMKMMAEKISAKSEQSQSEKQFLDTFGKLVKANGSTGWENGMKLTAKAIADSWVAKNEGYRASMGELPAYGVGNTITNTTGYAPPAHVDPSMAQMFMILLDQAKKVKGK